MGRKKYFTEEERKAAKREYRKQYYQKNAEKEKEMAKCWRDANPDYRKRYYQENAEKEKERYKSYYQENREKILEQHKEHKKQYNKTPMGRAVYLVHSYKQEDKKRNRGECTLTAQWIIENIFSKPCHYCCGKEGWEVIGCDRIDNDLPHTEDNVVPCCTECNKKRGTKTYEEFLMSLKNEQPN